MNANPLQALVFASLLASCFAAPTVVRAEDAAADQSSASYRIGAEDVLSVQVWGRSELSGLAEVEQSGTVRLPVVGQVSVGGHTVDEVSESLTARYRLFDPGITEVIVTVAEYNSLRVSVVGEVRNPGRFGFREIPDVWSAILAAGGATSDADLTQVQVVHEEADPNGVRTITVDISSGIEGTDPATVPALRTKDTIVVPSQAEQRVAGKNIRILGAVRSPGSYGVARAPTVVEAMAISGGALPNADLGDVRLTRESTSGSITYELDLGSYLSVGRPDADMDLRAGDILTIPEREPLFEQILGGVLRVAPLVTVITSLVVTLNR